MRSFTYLLIAVLFVQFTRAPFAQANETAEAWTPREMVQMASESLEEMGVKIVDEKNQAISGGDFLAAPRKVFSFLSEAGEGVLRLRVKVGDPEKGIAFTLVATNDQDGKVLSRRSLRLDPKDKDGVSAKVTFQQTLQSMDKEIVKNWPARRAAVSPFTKLKLAFVSLFGIPRAHAGIVEGSRVLLGIGSILVLMLLAGGAISVISSLPSRAQWVIYGVGGGLIVLYLLRGCAKETFKGPYKEVPDGYREVPDPEEFDSGPRSYGPDHNPGEYYRRRYSQEPRYRELRERDDDTW